MSIIFFLFKLLPRPLSQLRPNPVCPPSCACCPVRPDIHWVQPEVMGARLAHALPVSWFQQLLLLYPDVYYMYIIFRFTFKCQQSLLLWINTYMYSWQIYVLSKIYAKPDASSIHLCERPFCIHCVPEPWFI